MITHNAIEMNTQSFTAEQEEMLNAPMDASLIKHRPGGGGRTLAYISGKTAIDAANRIFGHGKWGYKILSRTLERITDADGNVTSEYYTADIELYVAGSLFPMPGDGVGIVIPPRNGSPAEAFEKARKEAVTDALKRALRNYGSQFGNDLYDGDALVDAGEGVLVKVKEVKQHANQQPAKRVVEAPKEQPPKQIQPARCSEVPSRQQPQQLPAASEDAPSIKSLRDRSEALFGTGKWHSAKQKILGSEVPDEKMTSDLCVRVHRALAVVEERRKAT